MYGLRQDAILGHLTGQEQNKLNMYPHIALSRPRRQCSLPTNIKSLENLSIKKWITRQDDPRYMAESGHSAVMNVLNIYVSVSQCQFKQLN